MNRYPDYRITVHGLMCQKNCATTVEKALKQTKGIEFAKVTFRSKLAEVWLDANKIDVQVIIDTIESIGFDAILISESDSFSDSAPLMQSNLVISNDKNNNNISIAPTKESINSNIHSSSSSIQKSISNNIEISSSTGSPSNISDSYLEVKIKGTYFIHPCITYVQVLKIYVILGMSCANCSKAIEKSISKMTGVSSIKVALLAEKAEILYDSKVTTAVIIVDEIEGLGYDAKISIERKIGEVSSKLEYLFKVSGMSCAGCVSNIEEAFTNSIGVSHVKVSLLTNKMFVRLNDQRSASVSGGNSDENSKRVIKGPRDVIDFVVSLGYQCKLVRSSTATEGSRVNNGASCHSSSASSASVSASFSEADVNIDDQVSNTSDDAMDNSELRSWGRLLIIASVFGLPVVFLHVIGMQIMMIKMALMEPSAICPDSVSVGDALMFFLNTPIQVFVGYRFYRGAILGAMHCNFGMDFLITLGTTITYMYSLFSVIFACANHTHVKHLFFAASGMLFLFVTFGKFLESYAKGKTVSAIGTLLALQPQEAVLVEPDIESVSMNTNDRYFPSQNEKTRNISINLVQKDDILKIFPGARIPTDGNIVFGTSCLDEAMITGESVPVQKTVGESLFGSTVNQSGVLYMRVTAISNENALAQIVSLVESAQMNKAPIQAYADRIASIFAPIVVLLALCTFFGWYCASMLHAIPAEWYEEEFGDPVLFCMLFAISVVVISCPCALGLATPTAIMVGTSVGALNGVLIKGGPAFEMAHKIKTIVFDKTGTLTLGKPVLTNIVVFLHDLSTNKDPVTPSTRNAWVDTTIVQALEFDFMYDSNNSTMLENAILELPHSAVLNPAFGTVQQASIAQLHQYIDALKHRVLQLAASAEQASQHPLAVAVIAGAKSKNLPLHPLTEDSFELLNGLGIKFKCSEGQVAVGNRQLLTELGIKLPQIVDETMWKIELHGKTAVCVVVDKMILGILAISDTLKPEAYQTVHALRSLGVDVWMVTGDNQTTAEAIAEELDIPTNRVLAGVLPAEKASKIRELQSGDGTATGIVRVAMVGDGINDSPALAQADLGIAIGVGTQVAVEAADMVLIRNNLTDVVVALDLAKLVFNRIRWNFLFSFIYNIVAIPFAAGVWYPWTHVLVSPQYAGLFMALSSISVVLSSLTLRLYKRPRVLAEMSQEAKDVNKKMDTMMQLSASTINSFSPEISPTGFFGSLKK